MEVYKIVKTKDFWWVYGRTLYFGKDWNPIKWFHTYEEALKYTNKLRSEY